MRQEALEPNSSQRKDGGGAGPGENVVSTRVWVADRCLPLSASPYREHRSEFQLPRRLGHPRFRAVFEASNPNSSSEGREGWLTWLIRQEEAPNDKIISRTASPPEAKVLKANPDNSFCPMDPDVIFPREVGVSRRVQICLSLGRDGTGPARSVYQGLPRRSRDQNHGGSPQHMRSWLCFTRHLGWFVDISLADLCHLRRARLEPDCRQPRHCFRPLVARGLGAPGFRSRPPHWPNQGGAYGNAGCCGVHG